MSILPAKNTIWWLKAALALVVMAAATSGAAGAEHSDPLLDLLVQKGMLTQEEVNRVRSEAETIRTNGVPPPEPASKWLISKAIKNVELYGDVRFRYEHRQANTPAPDPTRIELDRGRFAVRLGLRGSAFDHFYYGLRLETSSNPRSSWVTFGSSSTGSANNPTPAPFGKSTDGVNVGQAYLGYRPCDWADLTVGKMPNPLYTTPMLWDSDLNPEGAAERFKYNVGQFNFFAGFGQFLYHDNNPSYISGSLIPAVLPNGSRDQDQTRTDTTFLLAWQAGLQARLPKGMSLRIAPTLYNYVGLVTNVFGNGIGDAFIGEGSFGGPGSSAPINGLTAQNGVSYNQIGVNKLLVLDVPFEFNFPIHKLNARFFGDYACNLQGAERAQAAFNALATSVAGTGAQPPLLSYGPQRNDVHAYQAGFSLSNLSPASGPVFRKHAWEFRACWQHVEQYALDPNLLDSDFFEGRGNLQGFYVALAYGLADNVIGTFRYAYAERINNNLGTGGSNLDIPQLNPINHYNLLQLDITLRF